MSRGSHPEASIQFIRTLHDVQKNHRLILNPNYLDDEKLPEEERTAVLQEIFDRNIREEQLKRIICHLTPILDGDHPSSLLVFGPTGSGKTVSLIHVLSTFQEYCRTQSVGFQYKYVDLTSPRSSFGALNELARALNDSIRTYRKGIPIHQMQERIIEELSRLQGFLCLLIDEADNIKPNADEFITFLGKTLPRKVPCRLVLIMLTNKLNWDKMLDPRILSVLKKTDMLFEPYNALDLIEILDLRVEKALDKSKVDDSAVRKIAALASRETGDARKAVELLSKSAKVAQETGGRLSEEIVDLAEHRLEMDKTEEMVRALAPQQKLALLSCYGLLEKTVKRVTTGEAYDRYANMCELERVRPLTQRRFSDIIGSLDLYGLINARLISRGRYGQTREISRSLPKETLTRFLSREGVEAGLFGALH